MTTWREARAARENRLRRERRYYTPDKAGPVCRGGCGTRIPAALALARIYTHPTCGPDALAILRNRTD